MSTITLLVMYSSTITLVMYSSTITLLRTRTQKVLVLEYDYSISVTYHVFLNFILISFSMYLKRNIEPIWMTFWEFRLWYWDVTNLFVFGMWKNLFPFCFVFLHPYACHYGV